MVIKIIIFEIISCKLASIPESAVLRVRSVNPWNFTVDFFSMDFCVFIGNKSTL